MRERLEQMRDSVVGQIVDFDKGAALIAHDGITELIDEAVSLGAPIQVIEPPLPTPICVATFAQVRKAVAEAMGNMSKGSPTGYTLADAVRTGRKPSPRKATLKSHARKPKGKTPRPVARKRQSRRA